MIPFLVANAIKNVGGGKGGWGWMIYFWVFPGVLIG